MVMIAIMIKNNLSCFRSFFLYSLKNNLKNYKIVK